MFKAARSITTFSLFHERDGLKSRMLNLKDFGSEHREALAKQECLWVLSYLISKSQSLDQSACSIKSS
jgi:hypothetical protein